MGYSRAESLEVEKGKRALKAVQNPASDKDFVGAFLMATEWFYSRGGNQVGPVSSAELRACAERGSNT